MSKEIICDRQGIALAAFIIMSDKLIFSASQQAETDAWLAIILAIALSIPVVLIFARLQILFPRKNLFEITESVTGKFLGKILCLLFVIYVSYNALIILESFSNFVNSVGLNDTPKIMPTIGIMFLCAWAGKKGIEVMGRCALFFLPILIFLVIIISLLLIPKMNINNLKPVLYNGINPLIEGAFSTVGFPFTEIVMFVMIFSSSINKNSPYKIYISSLLIGGLSILITVLTELMVIGTPAYLSDYFTAHSTISRLFIGDFLQRLDIIPSIIFMLGGFIKLSICVVAICKGLVKIFECKDYRFLVTPVTLLIAILSINFTESIMDMFVWANEIFPKFAIPFQVFLPLIILICAEIKQRLAYENK